MPCKQRAVCCKIFFFFCSFHLVLEDSLTSFISFFWYIQTKVIWGIHNSLVLIAPYFVQVSQFTPRSVLVGVGSVEFLFK